MLAIEIPKKQILVLKLECFLSIISYFVNPDALFFKPEHTAKIILRAVLSIFNSTIVVFILFYNDYVKTFLFLQCISKHKRAS